ncbi:TIGR02757 family protein [Pedobacter sp.]|uniref:TIGR02757 family protein n=1 Tax=Pedobacter sp. TaxID=1411316 RepID=UPI003BA888E8
MDRLELQNFLDAKVDQYNRPDFIPNDPICIPHLFSKKQDIEIAGFFAAILAWGQRKTIINKCKELLQRMDNAPFEFVSQHNDQDLKALLNFKHRTFNDTDLLYFIAFFKFHYSQSDTLETAFLPQKSSGFRAEYLEISSDRETLEMASAVCMSGDLNFTITEALNAFRDYFFSLSDYPQRTKKHISSPRQKSTCKRLNMFLRWMVRNDDKGVDFGIWEVVKPAHLICPCDVHVDRVGRLLGLISRKQTDWLTAVELTQQLKTFDSGDPVKYDFALFGLGVEGIL